MFSLVFHFKRCVVCFERDWNMNLATFKNVFLDLHSDNIWGKIHV